MYRVIQHSIFVPDMSNSSDKITCYGINSSHTYTNNTQCPGSDSCCQTAEQCRPDRLCTSNESDKVLVRAACSQNPWSSQACATICLYGLFLVPCVWAVGWLTEQDNKDGFLPRVTICNDGCYCCQKDTNCCADKTGLWLSENGEILGRANETSNPLASTSSSSPTASSTSTSSSSSDSSGLSKPATLGVGIGVGVGGAAVIGLLLFWFFWRRRKNNIANNNIANNSDNASSAPTQYQHYSYQTQMSMPQSFQGDYVPVNTVEPARVNELEDTKVTAHPAELPVTSQRAELP